MRSWNGKWLKTRNFDVETELGFVLGTCMRCHKHKLVYKVPMDQKYLNKYEDIYIYTICLVTL